MHMNPGYYGGSTPQTAKKPDCTEVINAVNTDTEGTCATNAEIASAETVNVAVEGVTTENATTDDQPSHTVVLHAP